MNKHLFPVFALALCASCSASSNPTDAVPETEPLALDEGTGADLDTPDPTPASDPCIDEDICDEVAIRSELDVEAGPGGRPTRYVVGARLLVLTYAPFHTTPSAKGPLLTAAPPHGGVPQDGLHLWGNPRGVLSPAQEVVLESPLRYSGFFKVSYGGKTGYVLTSKVVLANPEHDAVAFAKRPDVRNAFFKHQIHRNRWNKDGPSHSGNCAPTSLAMALSILGKEPAGLSVEESIHRVRLSYDTPFHSDSGPTSRLQIQQAAKALGLHVAPLGDARTGAHALARVAAELADHRLVVLEGDTGNGSSVYQRAMNRAYAAAIRAGQALYHSTYDFSGFHSIVVISREANGHYIVGDPFSEVGFVTLTPAELEDFMSRWSGHHGTGNAVWVP